MYFLAGTVDRVLLYFGTVTWQYRALLYLYPEDIRRAAVAHLPPAREFSDTAEDSQNAFQAKVNWVQRNRIWESTRLILTHYLQRILQHIGKPGVL